MTTRRPAGLPNRVGLRQIDFSDITPDLARRSGFAGVADLPKVAKPGPGETVYLAPVAYRPRRSPAP